VPTSRASDLAESKPTVTGQNTNNLQSRDTSEDKDTAGSTGYKSRKGEEKEREREREEDKPMRRQEGNEKTEFN
jgi:hypothetical protein